MNNCKNKLHIVLKVYVTVKIYKHFWLTDENFEQKKVAITVK